MTNDIQAVRDWLRKLQTSISDGFLALDPSANLREDEWQYDHGGGGRSRVITGEVLEKSGVNFSHIKGKSLPATATARRPELAGRSFQAMGVSVVAHPTNPHCPTSHMNVRCFVAEAEGEEPVWWFGGGFDLTPYYPSMEDCILWHEHAKAACDGYSDSAYAEYKKWCDEYFHIKHRNEPRGIGGLFFDDLDTPDFDTCFALMRDVGTNYLAAYETLVQRRKDEAYTDAQRQFQLYRRGRYVEFNLVYDRGTLFGLQAGGRIESILMSMPPMVAWEYDWKPEPGTPEAELYDTYLQPRDWLPA